jgi:vacuolar-type H+-ATPase subunit I/STV1
MPRVLHRFLRRIVSPLRHDPAWFELASILGAIGWAGLGIISDYDFDDWPSMKFISQFVGAAPLYFALALGAFQGIAVFGGIDHRIAVWLRAVAAFLASWWWIYLGLGIATSLPAINMHVALYVVMGVINLMAMGRLAMEPGGDG